MRVKVPENSYIKSISINESSVEIDFQRKKKVALLFISLNERYWPYLKQCIEDCHTHFLPHHNVDYFVWTDIPKIEDEKYKQRLNALLPQQEFNTVLQQLSKETGGNVYNVGDQWFSREVIESTVNYIRGAKDIHIVDTDPIDWPYPTLLRYHLFLNKEDELKDYDYVFYLDADMRVVQKISDEILGPELTVALHPMYDLNPTFIPPYEPNKDSTAYIPRLGQLIDEDGKKRFRPLYLAGGFQGGTSKEFLKAMKVMKKNIDTDMDRSNYIAIWNDESHWNKYVFEHKGPLLSEKTVVLGPEYVHPDSLIKEYYEPRWGRKLEPKIITLTKPFTLSKQSGTELNKLMGKEEQTQCPECKDILAYPGHKIQRIVSCPGTGKPHQVDAIPS